MQSVSEQLLHSTVRIEAVDASGRVSCGTGFYFDFLKVGNDSYPAIVTNKHVIAGCVRCVFHISVADTNGNLVVGSHERIEILNVESGSFGHPDPLVDLAIFPVGGVFKQLAAMNRRPYYIGLDGGLVPDAATIARLCAIEDIVMIGYPSGLWDDVNNLPIIRRGITATPLFSDYKAKNEFLIDAACFPGSSGSPVFVLNEGIYRDRNGTTNLGGTRLLFVGVLYAGPVVTNAGEIVVQSVPASVRQIPVINTMMNLGFCLKSSRVLEMEKLLVSQGFVPPLANKVLELKVSSAA